MQWTPSPPQPTLSPPSLQNIQPPPPLFPPRPRVFCIPATPPPLIPPRPLLYSLPYHPPAFPKRTSLFSLTSPPVIPLRPFIFSVGPLGIPPRPYFMSGECVPVSHSAIPERLFFLSGECVSHFLFLISSYVAFCVGSHSGLAQEGLIFRPVLEAVLFRGGWKKSLKGQKFLYSTHLTPFCVRFSAKN